MTLTMSSSPSFLTRLRAAARDRTFPEPEAAESTEARLERIHAADLLLIEEYVDRAKSETSCRYAQLRDESKERAVRERDERYQRRMEASLERHDRVRADLRSKVAEHRNSELGLDKGIDAVLQRLAKEAEESDERSRDRSSDHGRDRRGCTPSPKTPGKKRRDALRPADSSRDRRRCDLSPRTPGKKRRDALRPADSSRDRSRRDLSPRTPTMGGRDTHSKKEQRDKHKDRRAGRVLPLDTLSSSVSGSEDSSRRGSPDSSDGEWKRVSRKKKGSRLSGSSRERHACRDACHATQLKVPEFHGDPLQYARFIRIFRQAVEKRTPDYEARLAHLMSVCKGKAYQLIAHLGSSRPKAAYRKALERLHQKFGRDRCVADAWTARLTRGEFEGVDEFALDLRSALESLTELGYAYLMDNATSIDILAQRLPSQLRDDWEHRAFGIEVDRDLRFKDFVYFVERRGGTRAGRPMGGPIKARPGCLPKAKMALAHATQMEDSDSRSDRRSYRDVVRDSPPAHSYATQKDNAFSSRKDDDDDICGVCGGGHFIGECPDVLRARPEKRRALMNRAGVCFVCLELGHSAWECVRKMWCEVSGCRRRHHTVLHLDRTYQPSYRGSTRSEDGSSGFDSDSSRRSRKRRSRKRRRSASVSPASTSAADRGRRA